MRLLVYGGSFDPIHEGHLHAARRARERLGFDRVLLVPTLCPPHKEADALTPFEDRLALLEAVARDDPRLLVCDVEAREGTRFTIDTLERIRRRAAPETEIAFLLGSDSLLDLPQWHRAEDLARRFRIVTFPRDPTHDAAFLRRALRGRLPEALVDRLLAGFVAVAPLPISATDIRNRLAAGESVAGLVPEQALRVLRRRGLYGGPRSPRSGP